jgi:hypothetical protein
VYGLTQTSPPAAEPLSTAEGKAWLRLSPSFTDDDTLVDDLIADAREYVERVSGRQLVTASYTLTLDGFPGGINPSGDPAGRGGPPPAWFRWDRACIGPWSVYIPKPPLQSVTAVTYYDLAGNLQTLAPAVYDVDPSKDPGVLSLSQYQVWPITRLRPGAVQIAFAAGYGLASAVPGVYRRAMRMLLNLWYEHRGEDGDRQDSPAVDALLASASNGALEYGGAS